MAFDFIAQVENYLEKTPLNQVELARRLGVSEGAISKFLNNPQNLTLRTIAKYARAIGIKAAIVGYDDSDMKDVAGLISSEIFTRCWERAGKPRNSWDLEISQTAATTTTKVMVVYVGATGASPAYGNCGNRAWIGPGMYTAIVARSYEVPGMTITAPTSMTTTGGTIARR
jgi:transcriptional regulator with XRE-family HTH domain